MDYAVNVRAILSLFYIGTGGMDIGLVNSCQGIAGGKSWERSFYNHSPEICKSIMDVVNVTLDANLNEEIDLTIQEKLEGKYSESEIASLTQKYHAKIKQELMKLTTYAYHYHLIWNGRKREQGILTIACLDMHTI